MLYDVIATCLMPSTWWGRLQVKGLETVPGRGPALIVPNHDSQWDPVIVGLALRGRRRVHYLARASLWRIPLLGRVLDGMGQVPIKRGGGDSAALDRAVATLRAGRVVGIFPEGRLTWGLPVRARSGVGLLSGWCPEARVVLCTVEGATDFVRFPRRPRVTVTFFEPRGGGMQPGEDPTACAARLLAEIRERVPPAPAGRRAIVGGPPRIRRAAAAGRD